MNSEIFTYLAVFIFGLIFGSFYNVLIYRLPRNISIVSPPSHCPHCKQKLKWYDNIPVLSFLILKGRCRYCGEKISVRYPLVELTSGFLAVLSYHKWGLSVDGVVYYFFFSTLLVISLIDWHYFIIPPELNIGGLVIALLVSPFREDITWQESLIGALIGFLVPFLIYLYYVKVRKIEGLGFGDIIFLSFIGAMGGAYAVFVSLALGSLLGLLYVIPLIIKHKNLNFAIPLVPFLSLGAFLGIVFKEEILKLLMGV